MTTTDAIQVSSKYCAAPLEKETISCSSSDILGKTHSVFTDRLCDNFRDCPNGEDEGELSPCEAVGEPTPSGCCRTMFFNGEECVYDSDFRGFDSWICNDENGQIVKSIYFVRETGFWYIGDGAQPEDIFAGWRFFDEIEGGELCPPQTIWSRGNAVTCKVKPVTTDFCADKVCAGNLVCVNRLDQAECICKAPNFMKVSY